ncbi:Hypothetical predicted protein [Cloeon dipterum]|nr:Hypothetical predicted protein [Cloeon dipterum]
MLFGCQVSRNTDHTDNKDTKTAMRMPEDCFGCRMVSGGGLIGAGLYVAFQSKRANNLSVKVAMNTIALGAAGLGCARVLNLPPFNNIHKANKENPASVQSTETN